MFYKKIIEHGQGHIYLFPQINGLEDIQKIINELGYLWAEMPEITNKVTAQVAIYYKKKDKINDGFYIYTHSYNQISREIKLLLINDICHVNDATIYVRICFDNSLNDNLISKYSTMPARILYANAKVLAGKLGDVAGVTTIGACAYMLYKFREKFVSKDSSDELKLRELEINENPSIVMI